MWEKKNMETKLISLFQTLLNSSEFCKSTILGSATSLICWEEEITSISHEYFKYRMKIENKELTAICYLQLKVSGSWKMA